MIEFLLRVRGVFSGTLKKKLGLTLAFAKEERGRVCFRRRLHSPADVAMPLHLVGSSSNFRFRARSTVV